MFRLQRQNRATKSGEKIDFKFSNFQAIRVPKGWDKLFVTVVSVESGKTIAKSSKAAVKSGNCQWVETLSESIWFPQYDSIKVLEECLFKFVISMGSARSGILGEATVNMADYMTSKAPVPVFLQLKKCNHGSILQVKIHCLTPRTKLREEESNSTNSHTEEQDAENRHMEDKSNGSSDSFSGNVGYPASKELGSTSHPGELQSSETSLSATASHHGFSSTEYCKNCMREIFSPRIHDVNGDNYSSVGRQDSIISSVASSHTSYPAEDPSLSNNASFNSAVTYYSANGSQTQWKETPCSSQRVSNASFSVPNPGSSEKLREAAEDTIEQLRAEARMWERNGRKLMIDLELLRMEFSDLSRKQADIDTEVSAVYMERDGLKQEVEKMKILLEESMLEKKSMEDSSFQSEGAIRIRKEMENEIKFQRECNVNLSTQLARSQESNIELLSVLQELEDAVEMQKVEIKNLSALKLTFNDMENSIEEKSQEFQCLLLQLQQLQESEKKLQVSLQFLEQSSEDKNKDSSRNNHKVSETEREYKCKLSLKEHKIAILEVKLLEDLVNRQTDVMHTTGGSKEDMMREIEDLKEKLQDAETDCSELTNENLELLFKLKNYDYTSFDDPKEELKKTVIGKEWLASLESSKFTDLVEQLRMAFYHVKRPWYNIPAHVSNGFESDLIDLVNFKNMDMNDPNRFVNSILNSVVGLNNLLEERIVQCEEVRKNGKIEMEEGNDCVVETQKMLEDDVSKENSLSLTIEELESSNIDLEASLKRLQKELNEKRSEIEKLEENLYEKEEEIGFLQHSQAKFESQISGLEMEKSRLEENTEVIARERSSVDSHVSENNILEMKCSELEIQKHELELHLSNLEKERIELLEQVSCFEAQHRCTIDERHSLLLGIEKSKSMNASLEDEIRRLVIEMDTQKLDFTRKLQDMKNQWSEGEEECGNLKLINQKLQANKAKMESDNEELKSMLKVIENELDAVRRESKLKVQGLTSELSNSKKNHELLVAAHEKMLKSLESKRSSEEKLMTTINDLEVKHTVSDHERQLLIEETASLKVQLQKVTLLHDEILGLKSEKEKLEDSMRSISRDCEELKAEKIALVQKIFGLETAICEFEECKFQKVALEEKLMQMASDTSARETDVTKENKKFQLKIQLLEAEKGECLKKSQALEECLKSIGEQIDVGNQSGCKNGEKVLLENELAQAMEANINYKMQLQRMMPEESSNHTRTKSSLEAELKDLQDRYFQMSLKYAEVEAQREDLVMKLKAAKNGKKWFS